MGKPSFVRLSPVCKLVLWPPLLVILSNSISISGYLILLSQTLVELLTPESEAAAGALNSGGAYVPGHCVHFLRCIKLMRCNFRFNVEHPNLVHRLHNPENWSASKKKKVSPLLSGVLTTSRRALRSDWSDFVKRCSCINSGFFLELAEIPAGIGGESGRAPDSVSGLLILPSD